MINKNNYIDIVKDNNSFQSNIFFQILQLFLEMIDEKYYQKDDDVLESLLNIGKQIYKNIFNIEKAYYYFSFLFNPIIINKFNLTQQEKLWKVFDQDKEQELKIKISDFKKCFVPFKQINNFFILLKIIDILII